MILDHIHQRLHSNLPDETTLPNGQKFDLLGLALLGLPSMAEQLNKLTLKLQELKFDEIDFICVKFLLLLNQGDSMLLNQGDSMLFDPLNCNHNFFSENYVEDRGNDFHLIGMR